MKWIWLLVILLLMESSQGNILIVDPNASGGFKTVSQAVLLAQDGDTILVKPGEYGGILVDRTLRIIGSNRTDSVIKGNRDGNAIRITAPGCVIENLSLIGMGRSQVLSVESSDNLIQRCVLKGSIGANIREDNNSIEECQIDCEIGMELVCSGCSILNSTFHGNKGLLIKNSSLNEVSNCIFLTQTGMEIISSSKNTLAGNNLNGQDFGIVLSESSENWIERNKISGLYFSGIDLLASNGNNISQNYINSCKLGISLRGSYNNSLIDNLCMNNERAGIYSNGSRNNKFLKNEFAGNGNGILLANSVFNRLDGNIAYGNTYGLSLRGSIQNVLRNNSLDANNYNIRIDSGEIANAHLASSSVEFYIQDIDRSNLADQKPICYLTDKKNLEVTERCGFVGLIGCNNITVQNQGISNNTAGIIVVNSTSCNIVASNISESEVGIQLVNSSDCMVMNSTAVDCLIGFLATVSNYCFLQDNNALGCKEVGFKIMDSLNLNLTLSKAISSGKGTSFINSRLCNLINCSFSLSRDEGITLVNSHKCLLAENDVQHNSQGLTITGSNACVVLNNIFKENKLEGLVLRQLSSAEITGNSAIANDQGIAIQSSEKVQLKSNNISQNKRYGLRMSFSSLCEITENNFTRNAISGVNLVDCKGNLLYRNVFVENGFQNALDNGNNQWDAGSRLGGNYWSDHKVLGNPGSSVKKISTRGIDKYPFQDPEGWK
jgi:parallel beta-helix repeat protein